MNKNSSGMVFLWIIIITTLALAISFLPLPYYQSTPVYCKNDSLCPEVGWNLGSSLFYRIKNRPTFGQPYEDNASRSCNQESDCVIGIKPTTCCFCPEGVNKNSIGKDGWELYEKGKNYSDKIPKGCTEICEQCTEVGYAVCQNNSCTFLTKYQVTQGGVDITTSKNTFMETKEITYLITNHSETNISFTYGCSWPLPNIVENGKLIPLAVNINESVPEVTTLKSNESINCTWNQQAWFDPTKSGQARFQNQIKLDWAPEGKYQLQLNYYLEENDIYSKQNEYTAKSNIFTIFKLVD